MNILTRNFLTFFLFTICLWCTKVSGQIYVDLPAFYDFYQFDDPLHLENERVLFMPRLGITAYGSTDSKFKFSFETSFFKREFYQEFPSERFLYNFFGGFVSTLGAYRVSDKLFVDGGFQFLFYNAKINGYGLTSSIGKGFRGYNIGFVAGGSYYFTDNVAVGARFTPYFFKMLKYRRIGDYGEFEPLKKDISTQRLEVFVRLQFFNSMNQ